MFNLSSFSSIMPFVILAITYFAGLTTYSLSLFQSRLEQKETARQTIENIKQEESSTISNASFIYCKIENYVETEKHNNCLSFQLIANLKQKKEFCRPPFISENFERSLYMRPPPSFLVALA